MSLLEGPLFSFTAQGRLGPYTYSYHDGCTRCYALPGGPPAEPTERQVKARQKFRDAATAWTDLTDEERALWKEYAWRRGHLSDKYCKLAELTGYSIFIGIFIGHPELIPFILAWLTALHI